MRRHRMTNSTLMIRMVLTAGALAAALTLPAGAQAPDNVAALVAAAGHYVADYERDFSGVVGELHEFQRVVSDDGSVRRQRSLVADILLVKAGDFTRSFRDVISVDGKAVRNREERLRKLFLEADSRSRDKQVRAIGAEGSRYDIGMRRGMDTLMLPLMILQPAQASGFRFVGTGLGLAYTEVRSPTLMRSRIGGVTKDMFLQGVFTIDPAGASVHGATLAADNGQFAVTIDIRYVEDPATRLLVPSEAKETYRQTGKPKADRTEVQSTYSNFRKFQVKVDEQIDLP